jgi:hypothetical protein
MQSQAVEEDGAVRAACELDSLEAVLDAVELTEGQGHRPAAGTAAEEERVVYIEQE